MTRTSCLWTAKCIFLNIHLRRKEILVIFFRHLVELPAKINRYCTTWGGVVQWVARSRWMPVSREFEPQERPLVVSSSKKLDPNCLVLVGPRNGFERDLQKQTLLVSQSN